MGELLSEARRQLVPVDGLDLVVFASRGREDVAVELAARARGAWEWLGGICPPFFTMPPLLVLGADDWPSFAPMPVYGMPQAWSDRLVVPATGGDLFDEYARTIVSSLGDQGLDALVHVYGSPPNVGLPVSRLAVAHEVGHYFHFFDDTGSIGFARHWIAELFANVAMYGYLAEREPQQLPLIETIVEANATTRPEQWAAHDIDAMGGGKPSGYIWAQFLLILIARRVWQSVGAASFGHFHQRLRDPSLTDEDIVDALSELDPGVADSVRHWPDVTSERA